MTFTIVKRNGQLAPFQRERIQNAIEAAFRDTKKVPKMEKLSEDLKLAIHEITNSVVDRISELAKKGVTITVEGIQDLVEVTLMKNDHHDVARDYIIYRDQHKALREDSPNHILIYRPGSEDPAKFNPIKIASSIEQLLRLDEEVDGPSPIEVVDAVNLLTQNVISHVVNLHKASEKIHIHHLQDFIENELMKEGFFTAAKGYILLRAEKGMLSPPKPKEKKLLKKGRSFQYTDKKGLLKTTSEGELLDLFEFVCRNLKEVSATELFEASLLNFYEGMKEHEIDTAHIMATKSKIEFEPTYSKVAARLLVNILYRESVGIGANHPQLEEKHRAYFSEYLHHGIKIHRLSPKLLDFDLDLLSKALKLERDDEFLYLGLQTLYDRYFIHDEGRRLETPQIFFMRVAMGLSLNEENKNEKAIEFYDILSTFHYMASTPTLFNAGTLHSQLSSCYLSTTMDDLHHIFKIIADDAQLSKWAGGLGNDWTNVRATGASIKGTNGESQGIIPFLKVANDTAVAVNQGGKRKGAMCAYLETWHLDIEDFLELRKNTGDERRRTHDMNTANWIPDLFMKRLHESGTWTLFSPDEVRDLHDLYGMAFETRYVEYEKMALEGKLRRFKQVEALDLWRKMLSMLFETGHPWITFKDPSNIRSPQDHMGVVHSSNLCTEILLNTSIDETAVCNLGSINLAMHMTNGRLDEAKLSKTVKTAIRMLDNVIDINFYPIEEARNSNLKHRPIGLGIMGFQDALYMQGVSYASHEAVEFADASMEMISYYAILASTELAKERGSYTSYKGSKWDRGLLPIDTVPLVEKERGGYYEVDRATRMDWKKVRAAIKQHGMRNSNTMAIAPTATIANIVGVTSSIEPTYKNLYAKSNLSGEFTVPNTHLIQALKKEGLWDADMLDDLKYFDGVLTEIKRIPDTLKNQFLTCFEVAPEWIIECASRRQKWIDMGQSLNLYLFSPSGKKLDTMYRLAWLKGLKTTYYLRSLGATQIEKSTTDINKRGFQPRWMKNESPSARIQVQRTAKPTSTQTEEGCESCQ
ncbi:MAG: ribonucleoside-diphosphate reductase subunit alpha [Simkaniaceae bacterium]|nr:ribonucleoside-diphosphate reductase subunit alpha [Simkaniaceae bacterium]